MPDLKCRLSSLLTFNPDYDWRIVLDIGRDLMWARRYGFRNLLLKKQNSKLIEQTFALDTTTHSYRKLETDFPSPWEQFCLSAVRHPEVFEKFRRYRQIASICDHVSLEHGRGYLEEINKHIDWDQHITNCLHKLDSIGAPRKFHFKPYGEFSPTLLRYLKVNLELTKLVCSLNKINIVEIGVGFGGQAAMINMLNRPASYGLVDLEPVIELARKYLKELQIVGNFYSMNGLNPSSIDMPIDLVISNYAFSELPRSLQQKYLETVILESRCGYITWNNLSEREQDGFSCGELLRLIPKSQILPEYPLTARGNVIITWN